MFRTHRSIVRRARKIDIEAVANRGEDYLHAIKRYKKYLPTGLGLNTEARIKSLVKRIDVAEREAIKLENKIERLHEKRSLLAVELENMLDNNMLVLDDYLEKDELNDF